MQTQTVFRAGNSSVVAIPKNIASDLGIKPGQKVVVEKDETGEGVIIKKAVKTSKRLSNLSVDKDFKRWWREFLKENAEILDELAVR